VSSKLLYLVRCVLCLGLKVEGAASPPALVAAAVELEEEEEVEEVVEEEGEKGEALLLLAGFWPFSRLCRKLPAKSGRSTRPAGSKPIGLSTSSTRCSDMLMSATG
jgi:hypothetical protein